MKEPGKTLREILPRKQMRVVALLAQGLTMKQIGVQLDLAEGTVKNHLQSIYEKLGIGGTCLSLDPEDNEGRSRNPRLILAARFQEEEARRRKMARRA